MTDVAIEMSVSHSPAPGCDWNAWVGFRPLSSGFSVLARYSGAETNRTTRIATSRAVLTWRSACKSMLRVQEDWLLCDGFLPTVETHGVGGWRAKLLASCWFVGEYAHRREIRYLCSQSESALELLNSSFTNGITGTDCLETLSDALNLFGESASLEKICGIARVSASSLLTTIATRTKQIEAEALIAADTRSAALAPFLKAITLLAETATDQWPKASGYAAGLGSMFRKRTLSSRATNFVLREGRLPNESEFSAMEKDVRSITSFRP